MADKNIISIEDSFGKLIEFEEPQQECALLRFLEGEQTGPSVYGYVYLHGSYFPMAWDIDGFAFDFTGKKPQWNLVRVRR